MITTTAIFSTIISSQPQPIHTIFLRKTILKAYVEATIKPTAMNKTYRELPTVSVTKNFPVNVLCGFRVLNYIKT